MRRDTLIAVQSPHAIDIPRQPIRRRSMAEEVGEGIELSVFYGVKITPADVARVLNAAKVRYVLARAHAVNAHTGRPRATRDVDVLTDAPKQAAEALSKAYPHLTAHETPVVVRLLDDGNEAVDVMKAKPTPLFRRIVRMSHVVEIDGERVVVPPVEGVLAMKFKSMILNSRELADRLQDSVDFIRVAKGENILDESLLRGFGETVEVGGASRFCATGPTRRRTDRCRFGTASVLSLKFVMMLRCQGSAGPWSRWS